MAKKIDLTKTVFELVTEYPELIDIMASLGFSEITKKVVLNSVGKLMTIPKGAKMKNIPMTKIVATFVENGFEIEGEESLTRYEEETAQAIQTEEIPENRKEQLKSYLRRLGDGEDLETVRADFAKNFATVEASEIMSAEQELLKEGTPLAEVQQLCDVHSALFHGATTEEMIADAENNTQMATLSTVKGHPLYTFVKENEALSALITQFKVEKSKDILSEIRGLSIHYAKKGDLLYPHLKVKYDISGPSNVMWTVDDEIRDELSKLIQANTHDAGWNERLETILKRAEEMIYKEQNILLPICATNFTEDEWIRIYYDSKDYAPCFGVSNEVWETAEANPPQKTMDFNHEIVMPGGHLTLEQLTALLNTIPLEITVVDANNMNCFFNEGPKVFKRPNMAIDRDVFSCHPPKVEVIVKSIIEEFREGVRDSVPIWMEKEGKTMLVTYMALRDQNKNYLGTVELVQDMEFAKKHFKK